MAIDAYVGLPGSGKSYSVVKFVILPSLKQKRHVITNIPLSEIAHSEFPGQITQLDHDWYKDQELFDRIPNGAVVVLDELWRRWPKGMMATKVPFQDKAFLAEHRHLVDEKGNATRIVLVTQDLDQLAAFATMLVDTTYQSVKLSALGSSKRFRVDIYQGAAKGQRPPKSRLLRQVFDKYEKSIHQYYSSATKSLTGMVGDETKADKRASVWRSPLVLFMLAAPILLVLVGWQVSRFLSNGMSFSEPQKVVASSPAKDEFAQYRQQYQVKQPDPEPYPPQETLPELQKLPVSDVWRVAGHLQRVQPETGAMEDVAILVAFNGVRYEPLQNCESISMGRLYQCVIDGRLATPWSGPVNQNMAGYVLGGASESINIGRQAVGLGAERSAGTEGRTVQPNVQPSREI